MRIFTLGDLVRLAIALTGISFILAGCGASASGTYAVNFPGPDGTTCYAIYQDGHAVGGNCK